MRYWQHNETGRLLKIDIQMAPSTWVEITKEEYEEAENNLIERSLFDEDSKSPSVLVR